MEDQLEIFKHAYETTLADRDRLNEAAAKLYNPMDLVEKLRAFVTFLKDQNALVFYVAKAPKSGSTFFTHILQQSFSCSSHRFSRIETDPLGAAHSLDTNLSYSRILTLIAKHKNVVGQQHTFMTPQNLDVAKRLNIMSIVTSRNLFDTVVSFRDMLTKTIPLELRYTAEVIGDASPLPHKSYKEVGLPAYYEAVFNSLDTHTQVDVIIEHILPWYFTFYSSWHWAAGNGLKVFWTDFMQHTQNIESTIIDIAKFFNIEKRLDRDKLRKLHEENQRGEIKVNYNVGKAGRGEILTEAQKHKIVAMGGKYLPYADFEHMVKSARTPTHQVLA